MANFIRSLINGVKFDKVLNYTSAANTGETTTTAVDCAGAEGVAFIVDLGAITSTGTATCKLQQSSDNGVADGWSDIAGSSLVNTGDSATNKQLLLEVINPQKRYVRVSITRATANVVIDGVIGCAFGLKAEAATQGSTVDGSKQLVAPIEGTA